VRTDKTIQGLRRLAALVVTAGAACAAAAQDLPTLARIAETGTVNLGHRESSVPFSYYDGRGQVVGYSHDLMLRLVDAIKAELKLPALTVRLVPVTSQNRIPLVVNGSVDLECGSTSHTPERARQVAFSNAIFVASTRLMVRRDASTGIGGLHDLAGQAVAVTAGTTSERLLQTWLATTGVALRVLPAKDHGLAFGLLESGAAAAFLMDDALLYGERAKARQPQDWVVVGTPLSTEVYACMLRRGDAAFKKVVDAGLHRLMVSGEVLKIYQRWFQGPIPPKGLNLNWPPSQALLQLYRMPSDRPGPG
jgi:glutamate/aspartate transport system substrate-binding protein